MGWEKEEEPAREVLANDNDDGGNNDDDGPAVNDNKYRSRDDHDLHFHTVYYDDGTRGHYHHKHSASYIIHDGQIIHDHVVDHAVYNQHCGYDHKRGDPTLYRP